jgi:hypothetical protein
MPEPIPSTFLVLLGTWTGRRSFLAFRGVRGLLSATALPPTSLLFLVIFYEALFCGIYGVPIVILFSLLNRLMFTRLATPLGGIPSMLAWLDRTSKVEAPIQRSDPFPHSMKPPKVDNVITQK